MSKYLPAREILVAVEKTCSSVEGVPCVVDGRALRLTEQKNLSSRAAVTNRFRTGGREQLSERTTISYNMHAFFMKHVLKYISDLQN